MKLPVSVKLFFNALLGSTEQEHHDEILKKYTLPERHTMPRLGERKAV